MMMYPIYLRSSKFINEAASKMKDLNSHFTKEDIWIAKKKKTEVTKPLGLRKSSVIKIKMK